MSNEETEEEEEENFSRDTVSSVRENIAKETGASEERGLVSVDSTVKEPLEQNISAIRSPKLNEKHPTTSHEEDEESPLSVGGKVVSRSSLVEPGLKESSTKCQIDGGSCTSTTGDICRICHMGGFPAVPGARPMWEWPNRGARRIDSQISTISSYAYLGPLISACKCRGTVGLVHAECLERWLTESGHTRCELCGYGYATKRVPRYGIFRSVAIWFNTVIATRQMLLDVLYLAVTTPLALFSCYVCALALKMIIESGFQDIPWMIVAMLPTCSLTLVAYWGWLITLGRYINRLHGRRWRRFWRNNFVVRLVPNSTNLPIREENDEAIRERMEYRVARHIDYEGNNIFFERSRDEEIDDLIRIM